MSKYLQIQIPKACNESWDEMNAGTHAKFCNSCQKNVIDFTSMSDNDLVVYFKKNKRNVCGRFTDEQLNNEILVPVRKIPWVKYFFRISIPAFLFSIKTSAQTHALKIKIHTVHLKKITTQIPIMEMETGDNIQAIPPKISLEAYEPPSSLMHFTLGGAMSGIIIKRKRPSLFTFSSNSFSIYPNPVNTGSNLTIKWSKAVISDQTVEVYSRTGTLMQTEIISIKKSVSEKNFYLKEFQSGIYIIKVTDRKTHKSSSKEFIVR